jgi:acetoin utilization deacetylase AcuC-like enzyme
VFNDAAIALRTLLAEGAVRRALVVDLDVHQGNGTAECLADAPELFTLSVHGARNFPFDKAVSDLDVPLDDGTDDAAYLSALHDALDRALAASRPELVIYNAGVDVFAGDRLGRLALSVEGVAARDRAVFTATETAGVPVVVTMGGGYADDVQRIVQLHRTTVVEALASFRRRGGVGSR